METINKIQDKPVEGISKNSVTLGWLGPVRMFVIALIAFGYASTMPRGPETAEYLRMFGYDPSWYGISILFMISGFLALRSLERHNSPVKFLVSRIGRILPILVLFAFTVVCIIFPIWGTHSASLGESIRYFFNVIFCINPNELTPGLLDNALYKCVIQGGIWTLRWGCIAYIATALLWAVGGLRHRKATLYLTAATLTCFAALIAYGSTVETFPPILEFVAEGLRLGWAYLAGMCAYAYRDKLPRTILLPIAILCCAAIQYYWLKWTPFIEISTEIALGYASYLGLTSGRAMPKWLKSAPDLSLGLYVFNWPTTQITLLLIPTLTPLPLFAIAFPLTILFAFIAWGIVSRKINLRLERVLAFG